MQLLLKSASTFWGTKTNKRKVSDVTSIFQGDSRLAFDPTYKQTRSHKHRSILNRNIPVPNSRMSWMDSWSRPSKSANFPPPIYLTAGNAEVPYCHSCGRVMSTKKSSTSASTSSPVKYCSERCRRNKPGAKDHQIEDAFVALLTSDLQTYTQKYPAEDSEAKPVQEDQKPKKGKGDQRLIVWCSEAESLVFGSRFDPDKTAGRRKNRTPRGIPDVGEWKSVDMMDKPTDATQELSEHSDSSEDLDDLVLRDHVDPDHTSFGAGKQRPSQSKAQVNGSVGGEKGWAEKIEETDEMMQKRLEGQRRAEEREMVRKAARRGVAFGFAVEGVVHDTVAHNTKKKKGGKSDKYRGKGEEDVQDESTGKEDTRKKCEAVITKAAILVEPSYAKGDWGIRWRELS